jgi:hypothetical protein
VEVRAPGEFERVVARRNGDRHLLRQRDSVLEELDPLVEAGLARREGRFIMPAAIVRPADGADWAAWQAICLLLRTLGAKLRHLCVCKYCTVVFRPRGRKTIATACPLCAHRRGPLAPALGLPGQRITRNGDRVTVRAPILAAPASRLVVGWRNVTIAKCAECGELIDGPTRRTCSGARAQRRKRRAD